MSGMFLSPLSQNICETLVSAAGVTSPLQRSGG